MGRQAGCGDIAQSSSFGREAREVKQCNGTETRHGRAEVLEFVRSRRLLYAFNGRHSPVITRDAPNDAT